MKLCHCTEKQARHRRAEMRSVSPSTNMMSKSQHFGLFEHTALVWYWRKQNKKKKRKGKILACHSIYKIFKFEKKEISYRHQLNYQKIYRKQIQNQIKHLQNTKIRKSLHYLSRKTTCQLSLFTWETVQWVTRNMWIAYEKLRYKSFDS